MKYVFVIDQNKTPLAPCSAWKATKLLKEKKASVYRVFPLTIRLYRVIEAPVPPPLRLKLDPGSKATGIAVVNEKTGAVVFAAELMHRGEAVRRSLASRRALRCNRRARKTRYRAVRFLNRTRKEGWLPPSLESRIANIETTVRRLRRVTPLTALSMELVRFDMQALEHPEIEGAGYQQGELAGYEVREYLLEKWDRQCAYCGKNGVPLQVEHIRAKARGGSNRISNLVLACAPCNKEKGTMPIEVFLKKDPVRLAKILKQVKAPLKDAAAVNTTRWALYQRLKATGLPVEVGTGGRTKFNRVKRGLTKTHWADAACVGASTPEVLKVAGLRPLIIAAKGHGIRQRCATDKFGFPKQHAKRKKKFAGFQTGDIVKAVVPRGKNKGTHTGRIAIRFEPAFKFQGSHVHPKHLTLLQRADGYSYAESSIEKCLPIQPADAV